MRRICLVLENLRQRGQALVELAFTLPLFLMMLFCIVYGGWVFTDYMTFSNLTRSCAHDAVNNGIDKARTNAIKNKNTLRSDLFVWNPEESKYLYFEESEPDEDTGDTVITVHVRAGLDTNNSYLGKMVHNLIKLCSGSESAARTEENFIIIDYSMYKENDNENTSK